MKIKLSIVTVVLVAAAMLAAAQTQGIPDAEKEAIIKTALDYGDGFYSGEAERMERAIHPDLNKIYVSALPQTGKFAVGYSTYSGLIELTRAKAGLLEPEKRKIQAAALLLNGDVACAKVASAMFDDFLTLVKIDGRWKIVNVLWTPGPGTPSRPAVPAVDAARDKAAILAAAEDYIQGAMAGDAVRMEKVLHPEVSRAVLTALPTGRTAVMRQGFSALVEPARAKLGVVPENARKTEIGLIDVMDGMAFVEITTANSWSCLQMAVLDGQWKIFNILSRRNAATPAPARR